MKKYSTKKALVASILALCMCFTMLVGTTFAWFTDSVTSANNKIVSGTLKVDLELLDKTTGNWGSIKESQAPLFDYDKWEPGYTAIRVLKVENEGTLALTWKAMFFAPQALSELANVIDVYVLPSATELAYPAERNLTGYTKVGTLAQFVNTIEETTYGSLAAGEAAYLGIALKMQESAGNEYQGMDLGGAFDIKIVATQLTAETDSFGPDYDVNADYGVLSNTVKFEAGVSSVNVEVRVGEGNNSVKVAAVQIPAAAIAESANETKVIVNPNAGLQANIQVEADQAVKSFDVKVLGLKEGNTELITVELRIPAGLDPATVQLYHYDNPIASSYNPNDGYVTFQTATFSPFTVVYDAESEYVAPEVSVDKLPVAIVKDYTDINNIT